MSQYKILQPRSRFCAVRRRINLTAVIPIIYFPISFSTSSLPARRYASAVCTMALCLSVCLSQADVLSKLLNWSSWFLAERSYLGLPYTVFQEIRVTSKLRVHPLEHFQNSKPNQIFVFFSPRHTDRRKCCQVVRPSHHSERPPLFTTRRT